MATFLNQKVFLILLLAATLIKGKPTDRQLSDGFYLRRGGEARGNVRQRRSDDVNSVQATVEHLAQQVTQLQAQVQANKNAIDLADGQMVGFTVRTKQADMSGFGMNQVVKFDDVVFNAGNAYSPASGIFTAPLAGTYVFYLQTLNHNNDSVKVFLDVVKNDVFLTRAHAGFSPFENGSTLAVTHLNQGDTIKVEVAYGSQFWGEKYTTFSGFRVSPH